MQSRRMAHLRTRWALLSGLRIFWIAIILWCESGAFLWSLLGCRWPDHTLTVQSHPSTHILLVADPQVLDENSYPGRANWLMALTRYIVDFNLRKSWNAVLTKLDPHVVVFLGDMMDNGRANMEEDEYARYHRRFRSIFHLDTSIPVYFLPGNHDVGLGPALRYSSQARDRYKRYFGAFNQRFEISNHTFVLLDAPGLVDEDYRRHAGEDQSGRVGKGGTIEFLQDLSKYRPNGPVVLLSHIPLSRSDRSPCGPLRERGTIRPGVGLGYQNLLLRETSMFLLENTRPAVVFSGDDHDYCEYVHTLRDTSKVREVTVKSFSMAMGIRRPGFQLLSLSPISTATRPSSTHPPVTFADRPCLLPNQIRIYTHGYAPLAVLTVLFLSIFHFRHRTHRLSAKSSSWTSMARRPDSFRYIIPTPWTSAPTQRLITKPTSHTALSSSDSPSAPLQFHGDEESLETYDMSPIVADSDYGNSIVYDLPGPDRRDASSARRETRSGTRSALDRIAHPCRIGGSGQRSWYTRAIQDLWLVAWPPICVYSIISLWLFWR